MASGTKIPQGAALGGEVGSLSTTASRQITTDTGERRTAAPHLFLVLQCDRPLAPAARYCLRDVEEVSIGRSPELDSVHVAPAVGGRSSLAVPDTWVSSRHAVVRRSAAGWMIEDANSKNGTLVNGRAARSAPLADGDLLELGHTFFLFRESVLTSSSLPTFVDAASLRPTVPGLVTLVPLLADELERVEAIAPSSVSVVIRGETGTGKEVAASAIHRLSRRAGPFVAVNCAALPKTLVESELFGYRKGAFSGATEDRPGLIRSADRGTLFLDEIGDLPPTAQSVLLRVLQEGEILPIGETRPIKIDIRLLVATHRDLDALVADNQFRADLLARVSGLTLFLPPLRERREDLGILIGALVRRHALAQADQVAFSCDAARALLLYDWPLNVRELEKCLMAALVLAKDRPIQLPHFPSSVQSAPERPPAAHSAPAKAPPRESQTPPDLSDRERQQREQILGLLQEHEGNITAVARALGKARNQIQRWIKRYRIDMSSFRG